ncbi:MAG TPA: sulfotransferase [Rhodothermales bacterium]|nr:sulfotransferase [Rhodothermales bacterium]
MEATGYMGLEHAVVLGCPRSGTTFLMDALNCLPEAECMTGTLLPVAIPHVVNQPLPPEIYDALAVGFERSLDAYLHSGRYYSRAAALQKWVSTRGGAGGFLRLVQGRREAPRRIIYKEPFLAMAPDFVKRALPEAKIIHIYRDGRDCADSLVRSYDVLSDDQLTHLRGSEMRLGRKYDHRYVPWWVEEGRENEFISSTPYTRAIWMWKYMVRRCHDCFSKSGRAENQQVMLLRYEDLMREPAAYGAAVLEHLGLEPSAAFMRRVRHAHTQSIGKYKRRDPDEIRVAERVAGDELALYGYK